MAVVLTCDLTNLTYNANGTARCTNWIETEYTDASNLALMMDELLGFDLQIYGIIEGALIIAFLTGHWAGKVCRVLGRT